ncbi:MAG TPA: homocysteine S-methyltransferase family protein [Anaerolineales bacterium]|nr:homocysteine S-methyltransferase family protein [Anaerolineales bacterium]
MVRFLERLHDRPMVADGATGTNLQSAGLEAGGHNEEWVLDHPDRILDLERSFVAAGAEVILTCTFGATAIRMAGSKYEARIQELNREAAHLARQATQSQPASLIAGSMGPLGKLLQPLGPLSLVEATSAYNQQAAGLVDGGVDLLVIETQYSMDEAKAAFQAVREVTDLPVVVSFSYDRGTRTMMGLKPSVAATTSAELGAAMVGVNCGTTLENALLVLQEYKSTQPDLPVWIKPNAGLPHMEGGSAVYDVTPEQMGDFAKSALQLGARVVGGCCGTTPAHVRAIALALATASGVS